MIQANELRIDNYVAYADCGAFVPEIIGKPHKIAADDFGLEYRNSGVINHYDPIPLAEAMSGHRIADNRVIYDRFSMQYLPQYGYFYVTDKLTGTYISKVEFIHEWQNLVYAMNKVELKIEL